MTWYAAHIILKLNQASDDACAIKNVVLAINARSPKEALARAKLLGHRYDGREMECPSGDVTASFHAVRKIEPCTSGTGDNAPVKSITEGVELATLDLELGSWDDLEAMSDGEIVELAFES
jgi:hypothetical protein